MPSSASRPGSGNRPKSWPARRPAPWSGPGGTKIRHIQPGNGPAAAIYLLAQDGKVFKLDGLRRPFEAVEVKDGLR